jgi:hypothetical protein
MKDRIGMVFQRSVRHVCLLPLVLGALLALGAPAAIAQSLLKMLEPGIGYSQFKQWAIENKLVFEAFTKDSMIVRDASLNQWESIRIQARFCGGDDYAGRATNLIIQQFFDATNKDSSSNNSGADQIVATQRDYIEFLSGKAESDGKLSGAFSLRRDRNDGTGTGLAIGQEGKAGFWEVGLFRKDRFYLLQTVRRKEAVCQ